jgi:hypothetical protein
MHNQYRDKENIKQYRKHYRKKNRKWFKEYDKEYRRKNLDKLRAYARAYYSKHNHYFLWKVERKCLSCGNVFVPNYYHQIYCNPYCRKKKPFNLKLRFKILQRDNFTCHYCGRKAPDVVLQIDHINPKSNGGSYKMENLTTACFDCNQGKKDVILSELIAPDNNSL